MATPMELRMLAAGLGGNYDYDMNAYRQAYGQPPAGQHLTDQFKLPNHMTFSTDSQYNNPIQQGGAWTQQGGQWHFAPSQWNLQQHTPQQMQNYFQSVEPNSVLDLPKVK